MKSVPALVIDGNTYHINFGASLDAVRLEGERHEIGLRSMSFALETEGWTVHYLGADMPYRSVADYVGKVKPRLLAVSFTASEPDEGMRKGFATVSRAVRSAGATGTLANVSPVNLSMKVLRRIAE